jgi:hypothetical protein
MPAGHPVRQDGITRPRVVVSVIATADGPVTLNRTERPLDDGPDRRWKTAWPPDVADLLTRREAAIEQRHHPTVFLEGSGTLFLEGTGEKPAGRSASHGTPLPYLAYLRRERIPIIDGSPLEPGSRPVPLRVIDVQVGTHGSIWAHYEVVTA